MKRCELCDRAAKMYCESDQAILCWDCDTKVHSANFLVERHPRLLLCRNCQTPTTWQATGPRLSPIFSSCDPCCLLFHKDFPTTEEQDENQVSVDSGADSDDDEKQEDCQVVPWRSTPPPPPPPPPACSSSGDESSSLPSGKSRSSNSLKRIRGEKDIGLKKDQRRRRRNDFFFGAPFSSRIRALFSEDSGETNRPACARRASTAVDLISSPSCSPPI